MAGAGLSASKERTIPSGTLSAVLPYAPQTTQIVFPRSSSPFFQANAARSALPLRLPRYFFNCWTIKILVEIFSSRGPRITMMSYILLGFTNAIRPWKRGCDVVALHKNEIQPRSTSIHPSLSQLVLPRPPIPIQLNINYSLRMRLDTGIQYCVETHTAKSSKK